MFLFGIACTNIYKRIQTYTNIYRHIQTYICFLMFLECIPMAQNTYYGGFLKYEYPPKSSKLDHILLLEQPWWLGNTPWNPPIFFTYEKPRLSLPRNHFIGDRSVVLLCLFLKRHTPEMVPIMWTFPTKPHSGCYQCKKWNEQLATVVRKQFQNLNKADI
jgi:hypothetical protein